MSTRQARRRQQRVRQGGGGGGARNAPRRRVQTTPWYLQWYAVVAAIAAIIVVIVIIALAGQTNSKAFNPIPVPANVLSAVENPPAAVVSSVGAGAITNPWKPINSPLKMSGGKPVLDYEGSEYCPYCAQDRWVLINALSRFGTFSNLKLMKSSATDVYPSTHTFTFRDASYSSPYLTFWHVEENNNTGKGTLQTDNAQEAAMAQLANQGGIPVVNLADRAKSSTTFDPVELHANTTLPGSPALTWNEIAQSLTRKGTDIQQHIVGAANWITAGICKVTKNQPLKTCMTPAIQKLEKKVGFTR